MAENPNFQQLQSRPRLNTVAELREARQLKARPNLNDAVEEIVYLLWEDERFAELTDGVDDASCVEGSIAIDNTLAAMMIRDRAAKSDAGAMVAKASLGAIVKSMNIVLRRHNQSRKQRRYTVGGKIVPPDDDRTGE